MNKGLSQAILNGIIENNLVTALCANDREHAAILVWDAEFVDQMDAIIRDYMEDRDNG